MFEVWTLCPIWQLAVVNSWKKKAGKESEPLDFDVFVVVAKPPKSYIKWSRVDQQKTLQMCSGKQSCYSYFMRVPKINTPINTLQAPSNSGQPCEQDVLFFKPLLEARIAPKLGYWTHPLKYVQVCVQFWLCSCSAALWTRVLRPTCG